MCLLLAGSNGVEANPVDLSAPTVELGAAGSKGYVEIWKELPQVGLQLGGTYLPFRYKFTTDPTVSGVFGPGFYAPILEAHSVLIRERVMRAGLPCGKTIYFWQDFSDPQKYQTVDKTWTGLATDHEFTFWRGDGWKLTYRDGRLSSLVTDDRHTYTWNYSGSLLTSIARDGLEVLNIQLGVGGSIRAISCQNKSYPVEYEKRPLTETIQGMTVIKDLVPALSKIAEADGKGDLFTFELTSEMQPDLKVQNPSGQETAYYWNPTNNLISREEGPEGKWTYTIGETKEGFGLPGLIRTSDDGKTEKIDVDRKLGIYTVVGSDGVKKVTQVFTAPGPLYNKVKQVEEISPSGVKVTKLKASYDEAGRLIRKIDDQGNITTLSYDQKGKVSGKEEALSTARVQKLKEREEQLLQSLAETQNPQDRDGSLMRLGLFYIHEKRNHIKALSLLENIADIETRNIIRLHSISYDHTKTTDQKHDLYEKLKADFPEKSKALESYIKQTSPKI